MKIKALQAVNVGIGGASVRLVAGDIYEVSEAEADNLIRGRYAEAVESDTEEKPKRRKKSDE